MYKQLLLFLLLISSADVLAQETIHITEEPFHKPIFRSDSLTVIELRMEKGDTSRFHQHMEPILYLTLSGATMWLNSPDGTQRVIELPSGWIGSDDYGVNNSFTHQIAVADGGPLHLIAILKNGPCDFDYPNKDMGMIYRENGFEVKLDSVMSPMNYSERVNIVMKGQAFKGDVKISPGNFFFSGEKISRASESFRYYRVFF